MPASTLALYDEGSSTLIVTWCGSHSPVYGCFLRLSSQGLYIRKWSVDFIENTSNARNLTDVLYLSLKKYTVVRGLSIYRCIHFFVFLHKINAVCFYLCKFHLKRYSNKTVLSPSQQRPNSTLLSMVVQQHFAGRENRVFRVLLGYIVIQIL